MGETNKERELEQWLDQAIEGYSATEPRIGLEGRVLASLQAEKIRTHVRTQRYRWWTIGAAAVAAIVVAFWIGLTDSRKQVPEHGRVNVAEHREGITPSLSHPVEVVRQAPVRARKHPDSAVRNEDARSPKLVQFPSPQPLTEQELMLSRYVEEFPERAVLVARAQTELRKQDEREMAAPSPQTGSATNLDQTE